MRWIGLCGSLFTRPDHGKSGETTLMLTMTPNKMICATTCLIATVKAAEIVRYRISSGVFLPLRVAFDVVSEPMHRSSFQCGTNWEGCQSNYLLAHIKTIRAFGSIKCSYCICNVITQFVNIVPGSVHKQWIWNYRSCYIGQLGLGPNNTTVLTCITG